MHVWNISSDIVKSWAGIADEVVRLIPGDIFEIFRTPLLQSQFHANPRNLTFAVLPFRSRILEVKLHRSILVQMNGHSILIQQVRQMFFSNQSGKFMYLTHLMSSACFYTPCHQLEKSSLTKVCDRLSM